MLNRCESSRRERILRQKLTGLQVARAMVFAHTCTEAYLLSNSSELSAIKTQVCFVHSSTMSFEHDSADLCDQDSTRTRCECMCSLSPALLRTTDAGRLPATVWQQRCLTSTAPRLLPFRAGSVTCASVPVLGIPDAAECSQGCQGI